MSANGNASYSWGEMLCPPGRTRGEKIAGPMLDALSSRGLIIELERPKTTTHPVDDLPAFLRQQSNAYEAFQLTALGKTVEL